MGAKGTASNIDGVEGEGILRSQVLTVAVTLRQLFAQTLGNLFHVEYR